MISHPFSMVLLPGPNPPLLEVKVPPLLLLLLLLLHLHLVVVILTDIKRSCVWIGVKGDALEACADLRITTFLLLHTTTTTTTRISSTSTSILR
jgi:hypothetical protein